MGPALHSPQACPPVSHLTFLSLFPHLESRMRLVHFASQAYEVMCVGMSHRPQREGLSDSVVPVCTGGACNPDSDLPSRAVSSGAQTLTSTFGIPPIPCLWSGSCGCSRNIADGLIYSQGIW